MVKQLFLSQHGVNRLGGRCAATGPKAPVISKKAGHHSVRRMVKFKGKSNEFRTSVEKGFRMHSFGLSHD